MKIVTAQQMTEIDQKTSSEFGIPSIILMELAGHGTCQFIKQELGKIKDRGVIVFVGPGNNGGDGLVVARKMHLAGARVLVVFTSEPEKIKNNARTNLHICRKLGIKSITIKDKDDIKKIEPLIHQHQQQYPVACLIDAIFGVGLNKEIKGYFRKIIEFVNILRVELGCPTVAIDLPSGVNGDTGRRMGVGVKADFTATYGFAKPAHFLHGGEDIGKLKVVDINIPRQIEEKIRPQGSVLTQDTIIVNKPPLTSHKGSMGHLLVIAGSKGMSGAGIFAAKGALYSGCGLVTITAPNKIQSVLAANLPEALIPLLPESYDVISSKDTQTIFEISKNKQALVIGPGLGQKDETAELVKELYQEIEVPMVVDADALNILAANKNILRKSKGVRILTPHPKEMARLCGLSTKEVQADRISCALNLCAKYGKHIIVVLKGAGTVIANSSGCWAINSSGNPGLAKGGTGDVLAGTIGSLLAQGYSPWQASCSGVYLHGLAGDILEEKTGFCFTATQLSQYLPKAVNQVIKG